MRSKTVLLVIITHCGWEAGKKRTLGVLPVYPVSMAGEEEQHPKAVVYTQPTQGLPVALAIS